MGKVITVASQKGGVGQTATVLNLGYSLSRLGPRVLLIDASPQAGMSMASGHKKQTSAGLLDLLKGRARERDVIVSSREGNLDFIGPGAVEAEEVLFYEKEALRANLSKVIKSLVKPYDYVLIDGPSGLSVVTYALMAVSTGVIVPVIPGSLAVRSLASMLKFFRRVHIRANRNLRLEGVVFSMTDLTSPNEVGLINAVREAFPPEVCYETVIPYDPVFEAANVKERPAAMIPEGSNAARAYLDLAVEIRLREIAENREGENNGASDGLF